MCSTQLMDIDEHIEEAERFAALIKGYYSWLQVTGAITANHTTG
jgi:hypothetical protein